MKRVINRVAVIGAGVMGSGIAALLAGRGIHVYLMDIVPPAGPTEEETVKGITDKDPAFRNKFAQGGYSRISNPRSGMLYEKSQISNITIGNMTDNLEYLQECDWVIEAALEKLDVKQEIMELLVNNCKPGTLLSTNTSGVSINKIGEKLPEGYREYFMGTHFFNPPRYMKLLEIIPLKETKREAVDFMKSFAEEELGKVVVEAKDTPNFIANRIGTFAIIKTMQLMEPYGFNIPTVDALCGKLMGRAPSASFRTADLVGLDILNNVCQNILMNDPEPEDEKGYSLPWFVKDRLENGSLGDKTKQCFYKRTVVDGKKITLAFDIGSKDYSALQAEEFESVETALKSDNKFKAMIDGEGKENRFIWENLKKTLLYAARLIPSIADDFVDVDKAMKGGFNWEVGLFEIWDKIGVRESVERMKNEGEKIPQWIEDMLANKQECFYDKKHFTQNAVLGTFSNKTVLENDGASLIDIGDGVLCLQFHTKGNAIDSDVVDMIHRSVEELSDNLWTGMVIGNNGKFFSAGADLNLIYSLAQENNWDKIDTLIERSQSAVMKMKYSGKPIVAAPFGHTLGGGAEIVMHAAAVTPSAETCLGLVETGVGLIPAGGGSTELLVRAVKRSEVQTKIALLPIVKRVWKQIATANLCRSAAEAVAQGYLNMDTHVVFNDDNLIASAKKQVLEMAQWGYHPPAKMQIPVLGDFGRAAIDYDIEAMEQGGFISAYDSFIAKKLSRLLTGAGLPCGTVVEEQFLLDLERETFLSLCGEAKTQDRIQAMLKTGKPLRN